MSRIGRRPLAWITFTAPGSDIVLCVKTNFSCRQHCARGRRHSLGQTQPFTNEANHFTVHNDSRCAVDDDDGDDDERTTVHLLTTDNLSAHSRRRDRQHTITVAKRCILLS